MATAPVSIAPGLTPHTLGILADTFEQDHRPEQAAALRNLLPFVEVLVAKCFMPLIERPGYKDFISKFNELSRDFGLYRPLIINQVILQVLSRLGNQNFSELYEQVLFDLLGRLLPAAREMEMGPELISAMVRDYIRIIKVFPEPQADVAAAPQNTRLTVQQVTEIFNFIHAATRFDYGLTAVLLVLEKSLPVSDPMDKWALLSACKGTLLDFGEVVSRALFQEHIQTALPDLESGRINITIAGTRVETTTIPRATRHRDDTAQPSRREAEMNWLAQHKDLSDQYGGQWIVLEKEELIANDSDYRTARQVATQRGIECPFIIFVPPKDNAAFMGI